MTAVIPAWAQAAADRLHPETSPWASDPVGWAHSRGIETWSGQDDILNALRDHNRVAVKAGHSLGKSFIVGHAVPWWFEAHGFANSFVITTAPTFNQVRSILWKEIKRAFKKAGTDDQVLMNQTELWWNDEIVGMGRKPADWDPDAFQGIHAEHVLVIIDEASGVPRVLWEAVDSIASNEGSAILAIGNPTNPSSHFRAVCDSMGWHTIKLDGLKSPNFTGEPVSRELSKMLMDKAWVDKKREEWGETSPMFVSRVRGEFPLDAEDTVIPFSWADQCRQMEPSEPDPDDVVEIGVDVGAGGDETVVVERIGPLMGRTWRINTQDPQKVVQLTVRCARETGASSVKMDVIGWGWGVYGSVKEKLAKDRVNGKPIKVIGVNVARKAQKSKRFKNRRAELWWEVGRELSRHKAWDLAMASDDLINQLTMPKYDTDAAGRIFVESKDDLKKRLGRSPDDADALLLAFYTPRRTRPARASGGR